MRQDMNTTRKGDRLEETLYNLLREEIEAGNFFAKKECCRVYWKKKFYSEKRKSDIIFDVAVEVFLPGSDKRSLLVLFECKNYTKSVDVGVLEKFLSEAKQVAEGGVKAVVVSASAFQSGAREFARSNSMGIARYFDGEGLKWELHRSPSASAGSIPANDSFRVKSGLSDETFESEIFDFFFQSPNRLTLSLWDFFEDLATEAGISAEQLNTFANSRQKNGHVVPFLEKGFIESVSAFEKGGFGFELGEEGFQRRGPGSHLHISHEDVVPETRWIFPCFLIPASSHKGLRGAEHSGHNG